MAARSTATVTQLVADSSVASTGVLGGTASTAGHFIPRGSAPAQKLVIRVIGTGSAGTAIVRATGNGNDTTGAAQTSPYPASAVFTQGSVGDLACSFASGSTITIGPLTADRFTQKDGNVYLDWGGTTSATFDVYVLPFIAI